MPEQIVIIFILLLLNILIILGILTSKTKNKLRHLKSVHANTKKLANIRKQYAILKDNP